MVALTGIECAKGQFSPDQLRLSLCKHVQLVRQGRRERATNLCGGTRVAPDMRLGLARIRGCCFRLRYALPFVVPLFTGGGCRPRWF